MQNGRNNGDFLNTAVAGQGVWFWGEQGRGTPRPVLQHDFGPCSLVGRLNRGSAVF